MASQGNFWSRHLGRQTGLFREPARAQRCSPECCVAARRIQDFPARSSSGNFSANSGYALRHASPCADYGRVPASCPWRSGPMLRNGTKSVVALLETRVIKSSPTETKSFKRMAAPRSATLRVFIFTGILHIIWECANRVSSISCRDVSHSSYNLRAIETDSKDGWCAQERALFRLEAGTSLVKPRQDAIERTHGAVLLWGHPLNNDLEADLEV